MEYSCQRLPPGSRRSPVHAIATVVVVVAVLLVGTLDSQATPVITVSSTGANIDDVIDWAGVDVRIDGVVDLRAYQFGLAFDPGILKLFELLEGDFLSSVGPTFFFPGIVDNAAGRITRHRDFLIPNTGAHGGGVVARVAFFVRRPGTSPVSVILDPLQGDGLVDSRFRPIGPVMTEAGSITIEPSRDAPEPTVAMLASTALVAMALRRKRRR